MFSAMLLHYLVPVLMGIDSSFQVATFLSTSQRYNLLTVGRLVFRTQALFHGDNNLRNVLMVTK